MRRKFKIGNRRRKKAEADGTESFEQKPKERSDPGVIHEEVIKEMEEVEEDVDYGVVSLDSGLDQVLDILSDKIEPSMQKISENAPPSKMELVKEMRGLLDEAVYPYLKQFADYVDELLGEEERPEVNIGL